MEGISIKQYLEEIKAMRQAIQRLKRRRKNLHLSVSFGGIDYSADRIQATPKNKMEEAAVRMSERLEKLDAEIARLSIEIDDRIENIESLQNSTYRSILYKRYVEDKSWEKISVEMKYSYNYICNTHGKALKALEKMLKR